jgi:hypothetical protein
MIVVLCCFFLGELYCCENWITILDGIKFINFCYRENFVKWGDMPEGCVTKIKGPQGESITPVYEVIELGAEKEFRVWGMTAQGVKMLMGKGCYEVRAHELFLHQFENKTPTDATGLPQYKHVFKATIEYLFRESCQSSKLKGRIRIGPQCGGTLFLWGCGFRVVPSQDTRHCLLGESGLKQLALFWKQVTENQPPSLISKTLENLFQYMLDNITTKHLVEHEKKWVEALKQQRLVQMIQLIHQSNHQMLEDKLSDAQLKQQTQAIDTQTYEMFLPQHSIQEQASALGMPVPSFQEKDEENALYMAMHHTLYDGYISEKLQTIFKQLVEKIQAAPHSIIKRKPLAAAAWHFKAKLNPLQTYYSHQHRWHFFAVEHQGKKGDEAKQEILKQAHQEIESCKDIQSLKRFRDQFVKTDRCDVLRSGQGLFTRLFKLKTDSVKALEKMLGDASFQLSK